MHRNTAGALLGIAAATMAGGDPARFLATHLRNVKVTELKYRPDGSIVTIDAYTE